MGMENKLYLCLPVFALLKLDRFKETVSLSLNQCLSKFNLFFLAYVMVTFC